LIVLNYQLLVFNWTEVFEQNLNHSDLTLVTFMLTDEYINLIYK